MTNVFDQNAPPCPTCGQHTCGGCQTRFYIPDGTLIRAESVRVAFAQLRQDIENMRKFTMQIHEHEPSMHLKSEVRYIDCEDMLNAIDVVEALSIGFAPSTNAVDPVGGSDNDLTTRVSPSGS